MHPFEFDGLVQDAALGKPRAWDRLAGYLYEATREVVRGMLNPPEVNLSEKKKEEKEQTPEVGITKEVLQAAQAELQRLGSKIRAEADMEYALRRALGFPKKLLVVAFERWFLHLAVRYCYTHYKPWPTDVALRQLHLYRGAAPPEEIRKKAIRECLVRLGFAQRAVLVLYNVGSVLIAHKVTFRDVAAILGWGESDQAAKKAEKLSQRGKDRIKQIWTYYECTGGSTL